MNEQMCLFQETKTKEIMNLGQVCHLLAISKATGRNWVRSGRLIPDSEIDGIPCFHQEKISQMLQTMSQEPSGKLRSRRNKTMIQGTLLQRDYAGDKTTIKTVETILGALADSKIGAAHIKLILTECALKQFAARGLLPGQKGEEGDFRYNAPGQPVGESLLEAYLKGGLDLGVYEVLIRDLLEGALPINEAELEALRPALLVPAFWGAGDDLLGLLYLGLQPLAGRKKEGIYYTPCVLLRQMIQTLKDRNILQPECRLWDPCCGSGNFLLAAYENVDSLKGLYGSDSDRISIALARINLALVSGTHDIAALKKQLRCEDSLYSMHERFDLVLGNPPWGQQFSAQQKAHFRHTFVTAAGQRRIESFGVFTELGLKACREGGCLAFILPESLMQTDLHAPIREYIRQESRPLYIRYWGNSFKKIQCPALSLFLKKEPGHFSTCGVEVATPSEAYTITEARDLGSRNWPLDLNDQDYQLLKRIDSQVPVWKLRDQAEFALGIVTGDNQSFLSKTPEPGLEPVWTGGQIFAYRIAPAEAYLRYDRDTLQQAAPEADYRREDKLLYRFISQVPVFAYDDSQRLTLNSANVLIPQIKDCSMKYVLAILNSRVIQYYYLKQFSSLKVLRWHLEALPIPAAGRFTQWKTVRQVNQIMAGSSLEQRRDLYEALDQRIMGLFGLDAKDQERIREILNDRPPVL